MRLTIVEHADHLAHDDDGYSYICEVHEERTWYLLLTGGAIMPIDLMHAAENETHEHNLEADERERG